jgi:hypothetical protein
VHVKGFEELGQTQIRVTDLSGKVVFASSTDLSTEEIQLSLPALRQGIYVLSIETASQSKNIKFIR